MNQINKSIFQSNLKQIMIKDQKNERNILINTIQNRCQKCKECLFKPYFNDTLFMKEIMPQKSEYNSITKCQEILRIWEED